MGWGDAERADAALQPIRDELKRKPSLRGQFALAQCYWAGGRLQEAQAGLEQARARRDQVENRLRLEVRRAIVERDAAKKKLGVAEGAAEQARESHRITQARFEGGLASVTDLLRSQTALLSAQARHLGALYETKLTEVGLELATGTLDQSSEVIQP